MNLVLRPQLLLVFGLGIAMSGCVVSASSPGDDTDDVVADDAELRASVWSATSCAGTPLTGADVLRYLRPGSREAGTIGTMKAYNRQRQCNAVTGCSAWRTVRGGGLFQDHHHGTEKPLPTTTSVSLRVDGRQAVVSLLDLPRRSPPDSSEVLGEAKIECSLAEEGKLACRARAFYPASAIYVSGTYIGSTVRGDSIWDFEMKASERCLRAELTAEGEPRVPLVPSGQPWGVDSWTEGKTVLLVDLQRPR